MEGLYIHIPFCKSKCNYCDFYSKPVIKDRLCFDIKNYTDALKRHIEKMAPSLQKYNFDTVYFGGGTPSLLGENLSSIYKTIKENLNISKNCEVTFEANPESVNINLAKSAFSEGFNRVSLGFQSAVDSELKALGRIHTKKDFENAVKILKNEGFKNISADIMLSIPYQTIKSLDKTLDYILSLDLQHISAYGLKIEKNTPFYKNIENLNICDEETQREMYLYTVKKLKNAGFYQYEISNFSKKGYESKHNLNCWNQNEYIGFGVASHSYTDNIRYSNIESIEQYIENYKQNKQENNIIFHEKQNEQSKMMEYIMLNLRKIKGINICEFKKVFKDDVMNIFGEKISKLHNQKLIKISRSNIALTIKGLDLANIVWQEFV